MEPRQELKSKDEDEERQEEMKKAMEAKLALRRANFSPERPDANFFRSLDSSIKRNTAVIKKLKQINEEQCAGLLEELKSVNLSKFVTEAVASICDAKLKSSDINATVQVCSLLHQRYKDFAPNLVQGLLKVFSHGKAGEEADADRSSRAMRKRSTLKLLMELYFCGVTDDAGMFVGIIKELTNSDQLRDRETAQTNLSLLVAFARQGRVFIGLSPDGQDEFYKELNVTPEHKKQMKKMIQTLYDAAVYLLQADHLALRQMEQDNARMLNAKGELTEDSASSYEKLRKSYDHLFRSVSSLAEAMDIQPPVMPEDPHTTRLSAGEEGASSSPAGKEQTTAVEPVWDDEETRSFYENLPDLRAFVPAVLLGESEPKTGDQSQPKTPEQENRAEAEPSTSDAQSNEPENASREPTAPEEKSPIAEKAKEKEKEKDESESRREKENEKLKFHGDGGNLESLLQRLPGAVSRDLIDQITVEFCYVNSKSNRKKLVRTLFNVPRTSLELLPHYSRMVATLSTCMKDITPTLLQHLEDEFNFLINKKDQMNIETKIKNIRFLGELAKFRVAPAGLIFSCLKSCLDDFSHHNIDVACHLLETCGRFLYRSPETSVRMGNMLDIIMRLKNAKNLDARHSTMVENAYYQCRPPERSAKVSKVRPPLHQYIRKLLLSDLDKSSIERLLRQFRKLPWDECEEYLLKCFMKVHKIKYSQVHLIASLTAGLSRYHDAFSIAVVDEVLEEIRAGLELNEYGTQQRRLVFIRFLGELYNYRLIESCVIFETLYLIICFGYGTPEQEVLDPADDYFRIRMVITLLDSCGHFFDRGSSKRKLDRFFLYFQRYVLGKGPLPLDVEFDLQDLFANLRPKMARYSSYDEANQALLDLEDRETMLMMMSANGRYYFEPEAPAGYAYTGVTGQPLVNGEGIPQPNGLGDEGESLSESESGGGSIEEEDEEPEQENEAEDEEDEELQEQRGNSEEDEHVKLRRKSKEVDPAEDADFEKELRAVVQESVESRKSEQRSRPTLNMMIPMNLLDHGKAPENESGDEGVDEAGGPGNKVAVRVLLKKGNKQQMKQLQIPRDSTLVQSSRQKEAAELEEKQDIKRLVLEYNEREEDERSNAANAQSLSWASGSSSTASGSALSRSPGGGRGASFHRQRRPVPAGSYVRYRPGGRS